MSNEIGSGSSAFSLARKQTSLVNRVQEMIFLKDSADKATRGEGGAVLLYGEAGIGKTRLTQEIKAHAILRGMRILYGRCPSLFKMSGVPPYSVWKEVIKDYLRGCTPEQLQRVVGIYPGEIGKIIPEVKQKLIVFTESPVISPDLERDRLFEAVAQFLTNISQTEPLIVVLDDLQWADPSSLLLLHYLCRGAYRENLLFLGAYRDTEIDDKHPLFTVLIELNRVRLLQSVKLKRLPYLDIIQMVKQILDQNNLPQEFLQKIFEKTNGNPFFIEEVIATLKEEGIIYYEDNQCKIHDFSKIELPRSVKDVLKERIGRLNDECQNILITASFIGNDFNFDELKAITGINEGKLLENMETILKTGMLRCKSTQGENTCSFSDILIRDVLYNDVNPLRRKKLHHDTASSLEKFYDKKTDDHASEIALHFLESGEKEKAFDYFLRAGEKAKKVYANNEAIDYFEMALKLARESSNSPDKISFLVEKLGDVKYLLGEYESCVNSWNEALSLTNIEQEKDKAARIHRKIAQVLWSKMGSKEKAEKHQQQALKILESEPKSKELSSLKADVARMYFRAGDVKRVEELGEEALGISLEMNDYEAITSSYITLGALFGLQGDSSKASEYLEQALSTALNQGCLENAVYAYDNLAFTLQGKQEKEKRLEYYQKGFELAKKIGAISAQSWIGNNLSEMYVGMGNINDALQLKEECVAIDKRTGNLVNLALSLSTLGHLHQILGNWDICEKCLNEATIVSYKTTDIPAIGLTRLILSTFYIEQGRYAETKDILRDAYEFIKKSDAKMLEIIVNDISALIDVELGEVAEAEKRINEQYQLAEKLDDKEHYAYADALKGRLLRKQRKWTESIEYFKKSLQELDVIDAKRWNLYEYGKRVLFEYSKVFTERKEEGDKEQAVFILNQALQIFQKIGAKKDVERVKEEIALNEKTQLNTIEARKVSKLKTGFEKLDFLLSGGIPENYAVVLTSPSCDEKDIVIKRFLENGARNGESTFFVTVDYMFTKELSEKYPNLRLFICNPQAESIVKKTSNVFTLKGVENLTDISISINRAMQNTTALGEGSRRICLNLVSDVLLQHHAVQTRKWLLEMLTMLKAKGFTILSVIDPMMHASEELHAILGLFDGEIKIRQTETDGGLATFLRVKRMRDQEYEKNEVTLTTNH